MIVLGIHFEHDAGAVLMKDGEIVINVEAERVTGMKHVAGVPAVRAAVAAAFAQTGLRSEDVAAIAFSDTWHKPEPARLDRKPEIQQHTHGAELVARQGTFAETRFDRYLPPVAAKFRPDTPIFLTCHSMSHAAGAVYMAGYAEACGLVMDAYGTCCGMMGYRYEDGRLTRAEHWLDRYLLGAGYHRIGIVAREIAQTHHLDVAGKVMGLQAYGEPVAEWVKYFQERFFGSSTETGYDDYIQWERAGRFCEELFPGGLTQASLSVQDKTYCNLVASMQKAFTTIVADCVQHLIEETGLRNVFLSGGCAMNIIANAAAAQCANLSSIFVQPNCGDAGQAMGAAVLAMRAMTGAPLHRPEISSKRRRDPYIGVTLQDDPGTIAVPPNIVRHSFGPSDLGDVARRLIAGEVIGVVRGRSEIGPRALGDRSMLAHASVPRIKDIINDGIKHREWWRPFAPVCKLSDAPTYFELQAPSRYMLMNDVVRPEWRETLAGITHVDGTARVQVLEDREDNPFLWDLLTAIEACGSVPVLLNTSFNVSGKPLTNTTSEALQVLASTRLDAVIVEDYVFDKGKAAA